MVKQCRGRPSVGLIPWKQGLNTLGLFAVGDTHVQALSVSSCSLTCRCSGPLTRPPLRLSPKRRPPQGPLS